MDAHKKHFISSLEVNPSDWDSRIQLAELFFNEGEAFQAASIICEAPIPPFNAAQLQKTVAMGSTKSLPLVQGYIAANPSDPYGHEVAAHLFQGYGDHASANGHLQAAASLSRGANTVGYAEAAVQHEEPAVQYEQPVTEYEEPAVQYEQPVAQHEQPVAENQQPAPEKKQRNLSAKITAIFVAVAVHAIIFIIAALIVVFSPPKREVEVVGRYIPPSSAKQDMIKKNISKQVKRTSSSAPAAASMMQLMKANAVAQIALPEVTVPTTSPLGMGNSEFGFGSFGGTGTGVGVGEGGSFFGSSGGGGLIGTLYDLKQDRNRKPTDFNTGDEGGFYEILEKFGSKNFSETAVKGYYKASQTLSFTQLLIPTMSANEGPKAFQVEKEVEPKGWFVHYSGTIVPEQEASYRFVGRFDDALMVYVDGRLALNANWSVDHSDRESEEFTNGDFANGRSAVSGRWIRFKEEVKIDILLGERPGGHVGGVLLIEKRGEKYEENSDGTPIIPLFTLQPLSTDVKKRIRDYPVKIALDTPVFKTQ